ncbi:LacI family DNA-binding transcriptional regulator [Pectobacterium colocasium]|uniref:LacI family DNA-binding transcriptional regulator n=1 Tax=Pectobacterium colocasium TaxID=2878098 RepID=UPI001CD2A755|nr:LacI family DNA-binding transcriptional regulator [Pectobacterium colocasium]
MKVGKQGYVSAQDVARRAGVSRSAVSRSFTPGASVSAATYAKVMTAAQELGYQVNDLARGLLTNSSRLVGLVVTHPEVGFRANLVAELSQALIQRGSIPVLINTSHVREAMAAARSILFGHRAEATIVLSGSPPKEFVELAQLNGQPLIVIGRHEPACDSVHIDNDTAARMAARLFASSGRTRLALAGAASATPNIIEREQAFCDEARALGLPVAVVRGGDTDYDDGLTVGQTLFSLPEAVRPDAVFCVNDLVAFGVIDRAKQFGLAVPHDLMVIGFDDIPAAGWDAYALTTFRQDPATMAAQALALLDRRQSQVQEPACRAKVAAPLIRRQSA